MCVFSAMRFGRVDTLGQYISEFDPEPDSGKKGIGQSVITALLSVQHECQTVVSVVALFKIVFNKVSHLHGHFQQQISQYFRPLLIQHRCLV